MGNALRKIGRLEEALDHYKAALRIQRNKLESDHKDVGDTTNNMGLVHIEMGKLDEAMKSFTEAVNVMKLRLGDNHPSVGALLNNMGK